MRHDASDPPPTETARRPCGGPETSAPPLVFRVTCRGAAAIAALLLASILAAALNVLRAPFDAPTTRFMVGPPPNEPFTLSGRVPQSIMIGRLITQVALFLERTADHEIQVDRQLIA